MGIKRIEKDRTKLETLYKLGYNTAKEQESELIKYLNS